MAGETNDIRVRVASGTPTGTHTLMYTVFTRFGDEEDYAEEIDLDVMPGTSDDAILEAAEYILARDYEPELRIIQIGRVN